MNRNTISRVHSGFTLIELLVVIAIIAILAAILFPVFAQAREKARQTSCLSNQKQLALAALQYSQDFDETMPMAFRSTATNWSYLSYVPAPADWSTGLGPITRATSQAVWPNSIETYTKSDGIHACPSAEFTDYSTGAYTGLSYSTLAAGKRVYDVAMVYNGLMHSIPVADISSPASAILLWEGYGKSQTKGWSQVNPLLRCTGPVGGACVYKPRLATACATGDGATSGWFGMDETAWTHGKGMNFVFADGHVKWQPIAAQTGTTLTDFRRDPFRTYDAKGLPTSAWGDGCHLYYFRPDRQQGD